MNMKNKTKKYIDDKSIKKLHKQQKLHVYKECKKIDDNYKKRLGRVKNEIMSQYEFFEII